MTDRLTTRAAIVSEELLSLMKPNDRPPQQPLPLSPAPATPQPIVVTTPPRPPMSERGASDVGQPI